MDYIEEVRKEKGMPVSKLTDDIKVSRSVYYQWLRGEKKPRLENVYKICKALDIDFNSIIDRFM